MTNKPRLVVFTGSGISAESGIATFRDEGGVWDNYDVQEVCSTEALEQNRPLVFDFFNAAHKAMIQVQPNAAHLEIAALEEHFDVTVVTQNIDDLHERAGSTKVIHLHGEITKMRDIHTDEIVDRLEGDLDHASTWRPHVVMFGEMPYNFDIAEQYCEDADFGMVVGTSLAVYPAAMLAYRFQITTPVILVDPNPPLDGRTFPNLVVVKEEATSGVPLAANLLLVEIAKGQ